MISRDQHSLIRVYSAMSRRLVIFMQSIWGLFAAVAGGVVMGKYYPDSVTHLLPLEHVIVNLIRMCIIPILFTSVVLSLTQFFTSTIRLNWRKVFMVFLCFFILSGSIGIFTANLMRPGESIETDKSSKLREISIHNAEFERAMDEPIERQLNMGIVHFIENAVPDNIFTAIASDQFFQIFIFSIIFGFGVLSLSQKNRRPIIRILESWMEIFRTIYQYIRILIPVVVFVSMASDFGHVGEETIMAMLHFIMSSYIAFLIMFFIGVVVIAYRLKINLWKTFVYMQEPLMIAILTYSGIAALPAAVKVLVEKYKVEDVVAHILTSSGLVLNNFGTVLYFSFTCMFVAQYYNHGLGVNPWYHLDSLCLLLLMSILVSFSTIGVPGKLAMGMIGFILDPLGLPSAAPLVLFIMIDYVIAPFRTAIQVQSNMAAIVWIAGQKNDAMKK